MEDFVETILDYLKEAEVHNYSRQIMKYDLGNILERFKVASDKDYDKGYEDGFEDGRNETYDEGYNDGYNDAKNEDSDN